MTKADQAGKEEQEKTEGTTDAVAVEPAQERDGQGAQMPHKPDSHLSGCHLFQLNPVTRTETRPCGVVAVDGATAVTCKGGRAADSQNRSLHPPLAHPSQPILVKEGPSRGSRDLGQHAPADSGYKRQRQKAAGPDPQLAWTERMSTISGYRGHFQRPKDASPLRPQRRLRAGERKRNSHYRTSYRKRRLCL